VDPSGFQSSLIDSSAPIGIWQGSHPSRLPYMPPRDLHFPYEIIVYSFFLSYYLIRSQHMRQFRPSFPPATSPEYRIYDLNKRLSTRTDVLIRQFLFVSNKENEYFFFRNVIISGGIHLLMNFLKTMQH